MQERKRKRKLGLSLIMAILQITAGAMIGMDIFILNIEKLMCQKASLLYVFLEIFIIQLFAGRKQLATSIISGG